MRPRWRLLQAGSCIGPHQAQKKWATRCGWPPADGQCYGEAPRCTLETACVLQDSKHAYRVARRLWVVAAFGDLCRAPVLQSMTVRP